MFSICCRICISDKWNLSFSLDRHAKCTAHMRVLQSSTSSRRSISSVIWNQSALSQTSKPLNYMSTFTIRVAGSKNWKTGRYAPVVADCRFHSKWINVQNLTVFYFSWTGINKWRGHTGALYFYLLLGPLVLGGASTGHAPFFTADIVARAWKFAFVNVWFYSTGSALSLKRIC